MKTIKQEPIETDQEELERVWLLLLRIKTRLRIPTELDLKKQNNTKNTKQKLIIERWI